MTNAPIPARRWFADGFILTVDDEGLHVEVTDYHAKPLHLGWSKLQDLGLVDGSKKPVWRWFESKNEPTKSEGGS